jgi:hypothetical protein
MDAFGKAHIVHRSVQRVARGALREPTFSDDAGQARMDPATPGMA